MEDELLLGNDLKGKLEDLGYQVTGISTSGEETLQNIKAEIPDIAVLDIEVKGEMNGLEVGSYIKNTYGIPIIYLTQFKDLDTFQKAKKNKPISYLTKPVNTWDLVRAIELSIEHSAIANTRGKASFILSNAIYLKSGEQTFEKVLVDDINYLKASGAYTEIYTTKKTFLFSDNISYFEKKLLLKQLLRVHRSWIVNVEKVDRIEDNSLIINEEKITIGKTYRKSVLTRFKLIS